VIQRLSPCRPSHVPGLANPQRGNSSSVYIFALPHSLSFDLLHSEDEANAKEASKSLAMKKMILRAKQSRAEANDYRVDEEFGESPQSVINLHVTHTKISQ
jgi:hypothetical protein